jgi:hypothetical protein
MERESNIEKQVCALEQAKKLKELGVEAPSAFIHFKAISHSGFVPTDFKQKHIWALTGAYYYEDEIEFTPVYSVAELGVMLDDFVNLTRRNGNGIWEAKFKPIIPHEAASKRLQDAMLATFTTHQNEAEARAELLIHLLEGSWLDAGKCNNRLLKFMQ